MTRIIRDDGKDYIAVSKELGEAVSAIGKMALAENCHAVCLIIPTSNLSDDTNGTKSTGFVYTSPEMGYGLLAQLADQLGIKITIHPE